MKRIIANISAAVIALAYAGVSFWLTVRGGEVGVNATLWLIFALLGTVTAAPLHECGHALFGLFSGVRARISFKSLISLVNPSTCEIIPGTDKKLKPRVIVTALGGITVNLLFIVVGVLALTIEAIPAWISGVAVYHIALFLINILPLEYSSGKSDGLVICELIKNEDGAKVMLAVLTAQARILTGKPIAELDEKLLFDLPQIREDDMNFIALVDLRAKYFAARGDEEKAAEYSARLEQPKEEYLN